MDDREPIKELVEYEESLRLHRLEREVNEELFGVSLEDGDNHD